MDASTDTTTRVLTMTRTFDAPRALVFKMWTQPEHMARWWGCDQTCNNRIRNDLRVGGVIRSEMTLEDGTLHVVVGKYLEIDEPERVSFTWDWENGGLGTETVVTVTLEEVDGKTEMTMVHTLFDTTELRDLHGEGWGRSFARLDAYLPEAADV
ncbi:MAG: SRPBCC domain-containing protein [Rhodospirillales bacterium]|nr:SRPBCC domain-containing protein [Rhodospirillales bacterium]